MLKILLISFVMAVGSFTFLFQQRFNVYWKLADLGIVGANKQQIVEEFSQKARLVKLYAETEAEKKAQKELLSSVTEYEGVNIYGLDGEKYLFGVYPSILDNIYSASLVFGFFEHYLGEIQQAWTEEVDFADGKAEVYFNYYGVARMMPVYFLVTLFFSIAVFLTPIMVFFHRKTRYIGQVKDEILVMAEGDLKQPVTVKGRDELGELARQLDFLRVTLDETISGERESRNANKELISAMSHDLRTPLTTLYGYLEILKRGRQDEEKNREYLERCIAKVEDIRELSNRMFEYSKVFEPGEGEALEILPANELAAELEEAAHYLEMKEFSVEISSAGSNGCVRTNLVLWKRISSNLMSNISKYGEKTCPVRLGYDLQGEEAVFVWENAVRRNQEAVESNGIGLRSVEKMTKLMGGRMTKDKRGEIWTIRIFFPIVSSKDIR